MSKFAAIIHGRSFLVYAADVKTAARIASVHYALLKGMI